MVGRFCLDRAWVEGEMVRSGVLVVVLALFLVGVVLVFLFAMALPSILWFAAMSSLDYSSWLHTQLRQVS
jgi:hypothetical protein